MSSKAQSYTEKRKREWELDGKIKKDAVRFIKFALFSASAGIIEAGSFALLNELAKFPYWPAYLIALVLSVVWNFTLNRKFTFKSAANIPKAMSKIFGYYLVFTPLSTWWGDRLTAIGWNDYIVLGGTMLVNFITEFLFTRFVVYRNQIDTAVKKPAEYAGAYPRV